MSSKPKATHAHGLRKAATQRKWGKTDVLEVYPQIQAFVIGQVGWEVGQDLAHQAIEGIIEGLDRVTARTPSQFRAWCYRIARNKVYDAFRSKYGDRIVPLDPEELVKIIEAGADSTKAHSELDSDLQLLLELLRKSKFPCDEILKIHYLLGLSDTEIGRLYGISKDAARMKINRCLNAARVIARKLS
ncbi:MAG: sigma-70 family RNA polymerase sigma factor [Verrucomicrobiota bacterium]